MSGCVEWDWVEVEKGRICLQQSESVSLWRAMKALKSAFR